jgi:hypothetical protein
MRWERFEGPGRKRRAANYKEQRLILRVTRQKIVCDDADPAKRRRSTPRRIEADGVNEKEGLRDTLLVH